ARPEGTGKRIYPGPRAGQGPVRRWRPPLIVNVAAAMVRARGGALRRLMGRSQVVRQRILIPPFGGSSPPAPATQSGLWEPCPARVSLRDVPAAYGDGGGSLWRVFFFFLRRSSELVRSSFGAHFFFRFFFSDTPFVIARCS